MGLFSKAFKNKSEGSLTPKSKKKNAAPSNGTVPGPPPRPKWDDAWTRKEVEPEEVQELLRFCTQELKSRGMSRHRNDILHAKSKRFLTLNLALDLPFLLLPFRPASDPSAARTFIRNFFSPHKGPTLSGERLEQELMLTEPMVRRYDPSELP